MWIKFEYNLKTYVCDMRDCLIRAVLPYNVFSDKRVRALKATISGGMPGTDRPINKSTGLVVLCCLVPPAEFLRQKEVKRARTINNSCRTSCRSICPARNEFRSARRAAFSRAGGIREITSRTLDAAVTGLRTLSFRGFRTGFLKVCLYFGFYSPAATNKISKVHNIVSI